MWHVERIEEAFVESDDVRVREVGDAQVVVAVGVDVTRLRATITIYTVPLVLFSARNFWL